MGMDERAVVVVVVIIVVLVVVVVVAINTVTLPLLTDCNS